jgi:LPXTG-motif cell wall-anchored protein
VSLVPERLETPVAPTDVTVVTVEATRSTLPSTGASPVTVVVVSGLLFTVGVAIVLATRRRAAA